MVATSAFGMGTFFSHLETEHKMKSIQKIVSLLCPGIDKPNVRYVIFSELPKSIEVFYQGAGRAGRDGGKADCVIFWLYTDKQDIMNIQTDSSKMPTYDTFADDDQGYPRTNLSSLLPSSFAFPVPSEIRLKRLKAIDTLIDFCQNTEDCRMAMIARYLSSKPLSSPDGYILYPCWICGKAVSHAHPRPHCAPDSYHCDFAADSGICDNCAMRDSNEFDSRIVQQDAYEMARAILRISTASRLCSSLLRGY